MSTIIFVKGNIKPEYLLSTSLLSLFSHRRLRERGRQRFRLHGPSCLFCPSPQLGKAELLLAFNRQNINLSPVFQTLINNSR